MYTAVVVGSGPNGLTAAAVLARAGVRVTVLEAADTIGGGARSSEAIMPGLLHDHCSAFHQLAAGSAAFQELGLADYGLEWRWPEIDCVHPLDGGDAGVLYRSVQDTAAGLGADAARWRLLFADISRRFDQVAEAMMRPLLSLPAHPLLLARFGLPAALPGSAVARLFSTRRARALFAGAAAHAFQPLHHPLTAAIGMGVIAAGHRHGWPVAAGGSGSISRALEACLRDAGGEIRTRVPIRAAADIPAADVVVFDLTPGAVAEILGSRLPRRVVRAYRHFKHGPGAFKVDFAVEDGVPWANPAARRAGAVHLGGDLAEVVATERQIAAGQMPSRPFVLVGQQYLADPDRSAGNVHPVWSYAHVPHGYAGDATEAIIAQIERFAPGFRSCIRGTAVRTTAEMSAYNPNYVGGDIVSGCNNVSQVVFGPRVTLRPYEVGVPGMYICSGATPPRAGAHGMCGHNAASAALRHLNSHT